MNHQTSGVNTPEINRNQQLTPESVLYNAATDGVGCSVEHMQWTDTRTHIRTHTQLTWVSGLTGPAVQCSSKLWTARISGSNALICESQTTAAVT